MNQSLFAIFVLVLSWPAFSQSLSFGMKGGGIVSELFDPFSRSEPEGKRYTIGPTVEAGLPFRLAAEVDVLYKRVGERAEGCEFTYCSFFSSRAHAIEIPLLAKFRILRGSIAPYAAGGYALRYITKSSGTLLQWRSGPVISGEEVDYSIHQTEYSRESESTGGVVAGGGVEFRAGRLKLSPEFRYTRWAGRYWEFYHRGFERGSNTNQAEILFGIAF